MTDSITLISPIDESGDLADANWISYLVTQIETEQPERDGKKAHEVLGRTRMVLDDDERVDDEATLSAAVEALRAAGLSVVSADLSVGLAWLREPEYRD